MVSNLLKDSKFAEAGVSKEDLVILEGLNLKKKMEQANERVPKNIDKYRRYKLIEEMMGYQDYTKLRQAEKKLAFLVRRAEEVEGLAALKEGKFDSYRAIAFPIVPRILPIPNVGFKIGEKVEFNDLNNALFLTHKNGYVDPVDSDYRQLLIERLKQSIELQEVGKEVEFNETSGKVKFRITIERFNKKD